ncbi:MAG: pyridoxamine 5'-phosphate oxidase family protein [Candidatus Omnitrophica bacterium]|nr:pyridoxamine 5'-phosphate oxidase family protein [Candidatus Omnitrophota bacterium]
MEKLSDSIINFFHNQDFVIVSTLDQNNKIHSSAKGIVGVDHSRVYLIDLYEAKTFSNLEKNPTITITAIDEHQFIGFALKGLAYMVERKNVKEAVIKKWEKRLIDRMSKRVVKNIQKDKGSSLHPESRFPKFKYLIEMKVGEVIDLTPSHLKKSAI